jgi:hypothetical protein
MLLIRTVAGAVNQIKTIENISSLLLCATEFLYICSAESGALKRIPLTPEVNVFATWLIWTWTRFVMPSSTSTRAAASQKYIWR